MNSREQLLDVLRGIAVPDDGARACAIPHYVRSIGLGVLAILIGLELSGWIGFAFTDLHNHSDFSFYYWGAEMVRAGRGPILYLPQPVNYYYTHPAFEAVVFVPFTFLPFWWAYSLWAIFNVGCLIASHRLMAACNLSLVSPGGSLGVLLAFFPVSFAVMNGEDSVLLLLLVACWSFHELRSGRHLRSGMIIGFSVARFQFLLPFLVVLALWKLFRVLTGAIVSAGGLMLFSVFLTGWRGQITYYHLLRDLATRDYPATMANLRVVLIHVHLQFLLVPLSLALVGFALWKGRHLQDAEHFLIAIVTVCIIDYHLFVYDLCILSLPLVIFAAWLLEKERYAELLSPLGIVAAPLVILLSGGTKWLWILGLAAPLLLWHMLHSWSPVLDEGSVP
jgi:hypothetical protein